MNIEIVKTEFGELYSHRKFIALLTDGHQLTVTDRDAYELQESCIKKPHLLRDPNEIIYRVFLARKELEEESDR